MKKSVGQILFTLCMTSLLPVQVWAANPFTPDSQPTGWLSTPMVSVFDVSSGSEHFYRIAFFKDTWSGNVFAHDIDAYGNVDNVSGPWDSQVLTNAALALDAANFNTGRIIATSGSRAFRWSSMTAGEKTALGSEAVLNYVRGDRSNEEPNGQAFRKREFVLGDILHSNITYWDNNTTKSLFVGANDGMLHVLDADTGVERWAYVPSMVIPNLSRLAAKPYVHSHYVDGTLRISNVNFSGIAKTMLVSGLGAGGKGLFALDVTSHTAASEPAAASKLMWEIAAGGSFGDLGYTYGTPHITRLPNGTAAVVFSNGYMSSNGRAVLYVVNAATGGLISAIDTQTGSVGSPNGLSSPTLHDADQDGQAELAYAGDLDGQVWKFNLVAGTATKIFTTSPAQAITSAPVVVRHPLGGQMVMFATGRMLTSGDKFDTSIHYAYGIWDGAPVGNSSLLAQTLSTSNYTQDGETFAVRTVTANVPNWASGGNKGWRVALHAGERVVGERPFSNAGRFYFLATNPIAAGGENFLYELQALTGGSPSTPIFDLNKDGDFDNEDKAANNAIPVAKYLGPGIFSQPRFIEGEGLTTTLYVFHPDLPIEDGVPTPPQDPGVSGGHFDYDIYYFGAAGKAVTEDVPDLNDFATPKRVICKKSTDVAKELDSVTDLCKKNPNNSVYTYLSDYSIGAVCKANNDPKKVEHFHTLTCNKVNKVTYTPTQYKKVKHTHEYDDKYDVTGVNMLNASDPTFNLINALPVSTTEFKVLIMNQYLNPAAQVAIGGATFSSVSTYGGLASQTSADAVLAAQPNYSRGTLGNFIFNLPLDAFKNKDWWGDGGTTRAGLIPTQTGCVNKVDANGVVDTPGKFGERYNGALTFQLIKTTTPGSALELNGPDVRYGWRVKTGLFKQYVLAEYTAFWHHPNGECYDESGWIPDPPEDFDGGGTSEEGAPGSADPRGGTFGNGLAIVNQSTTVSNGGLTTTVVITYNDGTTHTRTETENDDGSTTVHQIFRDGTEETVTLSDGRGGDSGYIDPNTGSPIEGGLEEEGRQSWRDIID
ncbi:MAG: PilC/PilY family type IV pilus protein [Xanthomonadales bacterium]|nr:PilC/PilY family type IV pilus protein [Xanthomonadales bacterium]